MEKKLLKKSKFAVTLYVISGLLTLYTVYMLYSTITYLTNYFSQYGTSFMSNFGTAIGYILTQCLVYLVYAIPESKGSEEDCEGGEEGCKSKCRGSEGNRRKSRSSGRGRSERRDRFGRGIGRRVRKIINCFSEYNSRQKNKNEKAVENIRRFFLLL